MYNIQLAQHYIVYSPTPVQLPSSPRTPKKSRPHSSPRKDNNDNADSLVVQYMERVSYAVGSLIVIT